MAARRLTWGLPLSRSLLWVRSLSELFETLIDLYKSSFVGLTILFEISDLTVFIMAALRAWFVSSLVSEKVNCSCSLFLHEKTSPGFELVCTLFLNLFSLWPVWGLIRPWELLLCLINCCLPCGVPPENGLFQHRFPTTGVAYYRLGEVTPCYPETGRLFTASRIWGAFLKLTFGLPGALGIPA